jgi:hypothetical protein
MSCASAMTSASVLAPGWSRLVRLSVRAGDHDRVPVWVADPDFAVSWAVALAWRWIAVRSLYDGSAEFAGPGHDAIEVCDVAEPQQNAVAHLGVGITDAAVVVLDVAVVQL